MSAQQYDLGGWSKLARLDGRQREVYESCVLNGIRPKELAREMDVEASTIRTHLNRARKKVGEA